MNTDEKILKALENLQAGQARLEDGQAHLKTAVEAVKAGQDDIREKLETKADKADIHRVEQKIDKVAKDVKSYGSRIENLEEHTSTPNPHKN